MTRALIAFAAFATSLIVAIVGHTMGVVEAVAVCAGILATIVVDENMNGDSDA